MNLTIRKCVQDRRTESNPSHCSKFDKYTENHKTIPDWFELGNYIPYWLFPSLFHLAESNSGASHQLPIRSREHSHPRVHLAFWHSALTLRLESVWRNIHKRPAKQYNIILLLYPVYIECVRMHLRGSSQPKHFLRATLCKPCATQVVILWTPKACFTTSQ